MLRRVCVASFRPPRLTISANHNVYGVTRTPRSYPHIGATYAWTRSLSFTPNPPPTTAQLQSRKKPSILAKVLPPSLIPPENGAASLSKIFALAKPERKTIGIAVGLLLVSSSVTMSVPFTIGRLIDFFASADQQTFLGLSPQTALFGLLGAFTIGALANSGRVLLMRMAGQRIVARLRESTYASALRQEVEFVEREKGTGDVMSRLTSDASIVGESITGNLSDGLRAAVTASVGLGLMFYLSPTLTLVMLSVVPPISLGAFFYGRYLKKLSNRTQEALGSLSSVAQESLSALRTVQAFNAVTPEETKFGERVKTVLDLAKKEALASAIFYGSTGWAGNLTILTLLGYGGTLVSRGEISVGDLTSLLLYTAYVGSSLSMLTSFFSSLMRAVGASDRIFSLLSRSPVIPPDTGIPVPTPYSGVIRFEDVSFSYPSRAHEKVLNGFNLTIGDGGSTAIVLSVFPKLVWRVIEADGINHSGKSGSGKSSVQNLLLRFYDPTQGRITFNGQDIRKFNPPSWRSLIGLVPQDPILFSGTIASNIAYGAPEASRIDIETAAREANCDFIWTIPKGLDTEIGRASLSGGQRQRIAIARALLRKPSLLCLDEATSALDAASELMVNEAIDRILQARHTTSLIVAHRLSTIARAERIVVLEDGRITEEGTYRELAAREGSRFRALMAAQLDAATGDRAALDEVLEEEEAAHEQNSVSVGPKERRAVEQPRV